MSEDLLRAFDEEFTLPVVRRLEERGGHGAGLGAADEFLGRSPIWAAAVERIEHNIAAALVEEAFDELAGGIVKDGRMPARLNLPQHLHDDGCLATSGVAYDLEMLVFSPQRNAEHLPALIDLDADSRPSNGLVELLRRYENRPLESPAIFHF